MKKNNKKLTARDFIKVLVCENNRILNLVSNTISNYIKKESTFKKIFKKLKIRNGEADDDKRMDLYVRFPYMNAISRIDNKMAKCVISLENDQFGEDYNHIFINIKLIFDYELKNKFKNKDYDSDK